VKKKRRRGYGKVLWDGRHKLYNKMMNHDDFNPDFTRLKNENDF
jgi:hypothetical protein